MEGVLYPKRDKCSSLRQRWRLVLNLKNNSLYSIKLLVLSFISKQQNKLKSANEVHVMQMKAPEEMSKWTLVQIVLNFAFCT